MIRAGSSTLTRRSRSTLRRPLRPTAAEQSTGSPSNARPPNCFTCNRRCDAPVASLTPVADDNFPFRVIGGGHLTGDHQQLIVGQVQCSCVVSNTPTPLEPGSGGIYAARYVVMAPPRPSFKFSVPGPWISRHRPQAGTLAPDRGWALPLVWRSAAAAETAQRASPPPDKAAGTTAPHPCFCKKASPHIRSAG